MTPKEKAIELVEKMTFSCHECDTQWKAKQCALVAVEEMLDRLIWHTSASDLGNTLIVEDIKYWQNVKHELEKLL